MDRVTVVLLLFSALLATAVPVLGAPAGDRKFEKVAVIHINEAADEAIDDSVKRSVLRRVDEALEWGADCIVFEITSYGGYVHSSLETADEIFALKPEIHTIAFVPRRAISGAAMLSLSCRELVMTPTGAIGDSQAIMSGPGGVVVAPEKIQTGVATAFRKYAEANGYPVLLAESMVRQEMEVTGYKKPKDRSNPEGPYEWVFFRTDDREAGPSKADIARLGLYDKKIVVRGRRRGHKGELLTLTANEALEYGVCSRHAKTLAELLASLQAPGSEVRNMDWTWAETASRTLLGWRALLFLLGIGGLYFSLKTPGTGVPEMITLVAFGLYFSASAIAGFSGSLEVLLFVGGIVLIAVEIFVLPGFGVAGIGGLLCILVSLGLSAIPEGPSVEPESELLVSLATDFLVGAIGGSVLAFILARNMPKIPLFRGLALETPAGTVDARVAVRNPQAAEADRTLIGREGVADTPLRPSGRALVDGKPVDVVSEGDYIAMGSPVRVVEVRGNTVVVKRIEAAL